MISPIDPDAQPGECGLFEDLAAPSDAPVQQARLKAAGKRSQGSPRLLEPNRLQVELRASELESLLTQDHRARLVWGYVVRQDLSKLFEPVKARGSNAGRAAINPRILFALWLYATLEGVGSGREVARLSLEHDAYRWICGGVSVNYRALNDFRSGNDVLMDERLTANVATLAAAGAISLQRVAQDGMRVRAAAGAASFRRQAGLEEQVIVGIEVVNAGSDRAQLGPMVEQVQERLGRSPDEWLVDGGFPSHDQIGAVGSKTRVYAPVPEPRAKKDDKKDAKTDEQGNEVRQDKHQPKPDDSERVAEWRQRMASDDAKELYKQPRGHGRVRERTGSQPRPVANARARLGQGPRCGGAVRARAQPAAHGHVCAATHRLGHSFVRNGHEGSMRVQEMTKEAKTRLPCKASASITSIDSAIRPRVDHTTAHIHRHAMRSGGSKTHSL